MDAPPAEVLAWAESELGVTVADVEPMAGGIDAHTCRLTLVDGSHVVLRLTEPDHHEDVEYLAQLLDVLALTSVPSPRHLAHAVSVGAGGRPAMLQSLLPGDPTLPVEPTEAWLRELVGIVLQMQAVPVAEWMHDRASVRWRDLDDPVELSGAGDRALLTGLRERGPAAPFSPVFGHDDFWAGNTLRDGERVVGVVDWGHAGVVSAARDVSYLVVDTSLCFGLDVGDRLVQMSQSTPQIEIAPEEMLVWMARSVLSSRYFAEWLPCWNGLGLPVTHEQAARRRTELLDRTLARLG
jgi:aminoglycoside phosphotransferase (APT) family kinase protein